MLYLKAFSIRVYKNLKTNHHLLVSATFPHPDFGHIQNSGRYLYLSVFSEKYENATCSFR